MKKKTKKVKTSVNAEIKCGRCNNIWHSVISGYGKHLRVCKKCGEQIMIDNPKPAKSVYDISKEKIKSLPKEYQDKIEEEIKDIIINDEKEQKIIDALPKDDFGNPIRKRHVRASTSKGEAIADIMVATQLNLNGDLAKKTFKYLSDNIDEEIVKLDKLIEDGEFNLGIWSNKYKRQLELHLLDRIIEDIDGISEQIEKVKLSNKKQS